VVFGLLVLLCLPGCFRSEGSVNPKRVLFLVPALITAAVTLWPVEAAAQRRGVYRGHSSTRVAVGVGIGVGRGYPVYASPYFYNPYWWGSYGGFYGGFYGYPYFAYPQYPPYGYGFYDSSADLRVQVTPRTAEVYVDGYLVGTVDDFDGVFQRVHMPLGAHEVSIYAPGFRSITQKMLFRPFESYKIKDTMQALPAGSPDEPRPTPSAAPARQQEPPRGAPMGPPREQGQRLQAEQGDRFGAVAVRVQPADAEVLIDGERWEATSGDRVLVQLSNGSHRVEVRKPGFKTYTSTVTIRSGQTYNVNVSLSPE
jgi:hypothetical protein